MYARARARACVCVCVYVIIIRVSIFLSYLLKLIHLLISLLFHHFYIEELSSLEFLRVSLIIFYASKTLNNICSYLNLSRRSRI